MNRTDIVRTLSILTANMAVSDELLSKALNLTLASDRPDRSVYCGVFREELCFDAAANLADLLIRSGENPELLAAISAGGVGKLAVNMAVKTATSLKRKLRGEKKIQKEGRFSSLRTKCGVAKNLNFEKDSIRGIALGILFDSVDIFTRFAPEKIEEFDFSGFGCKNWRDAGIKTLESRIYTISGKNSSGESVKYALKNCPESLIPELEKACQINRETQDSECIFWISCITSQNWKNGKIGLPVEQADVRSVRNSILMQERNLFLGAFFTAAANWLKFEAVAGRKTVYGIDSLNERQDKTPHPFDIPEVHIREIMEFFSSNEDVMKIIEIMLNSSDYTYENMKKSKTIPIRRFKKSFKLLKAKVLEICNMDPEKRLGKSGRKKARKAAEKKK